MLWLEVVLTIVIPYLEVSALDLHRYQCVQNSLARIGTNSTKYLHIIPVETRLHWLPVKHHFVFKMV